MMFIVRSFTYHEDKKRRISRHVSVTSELETDKNHFSPLVCRNRYESKTIFCLFIKYKKLFTPEQSRIG